MTKLYLVRHGETEYNKKGCYYGWTNCSLSAEGIQQGKELAHTFEGLEYDVVLSSDLKRAVETALLINSRSCEVLLDDRLRELHFGDWEGLGYQEIEQQYPKHWAKWTTDWINTTPPGGENLLSMSKRITAFMEDVLTRYEGKSIVLVSHKGCLQLIVTYLMRLPLEKVWCFDFEHGKYSILEMLDRHCTIRGINNI